MFDRSTTLPLPSSTDHETDEHNSDSQQEHREQPQTLGTSFPVNPTLLTICQAIVSSLDLDRVLATILDLTLDEMHAQEGSILLLNPAGDRLEMLAWKGLPQEIVDRGYIPRKGSIAEWVIDNGKPVIINGTARGESYRPMEGKRQIVSAMCVPLQARGVVLGTINMNRTNDDYGTFNQDDLDAMAILASQAAISIENSRLHHANLQRERLAAIGQTVSGIAHCIKNMLTTLNGGLSVCEMARKDQDWSIHEQGIDMLQRSINRVSSLALDMLEYSKEREPNLSKVNLEELFQELLKLTETEAVHKEVIVITKVSPEARHIVADSNQIFRSLLNLVKNAIEASPEGTTVTVRADRDASPEALKRISKPAEATIVIRVEDSGDGISDQNIGHMFEPFFSTKGSRGTGLGLPVTKKIIAEHNGSLVLTSPPNQSAVFAIYLPDLAVN